MIYYLLVFLSAGIFSIGLILIQGAFFKFAYATTGLLNAVIDDVTDEDTKQQNLIKHLGKLFKHMGAFLLLFMLAVTTALAPVTLYAFNLHIDPAALDTGSVYFYGSMIAGGLIPFLIPNKKQEGDYSDWARLLHRMILDNLFISKQLFFLERRFFLPKQEKNRPFILVTGLARAGTTAMTQLLYRTGSFHSLSYANMPFLMAPNLWKVFYSPKEGQLKERSHGDNLQFGYETIEALEEPFFKVFTNDGYVGNRKLLQHPIDDAVVKNYLDYQKLIGKDKETTYLAKNNNLVLRYGALKHSVADFRTLVVVRDPVDHASSLLKQHGRFSKMQQEDGFTLEYMNWLGHHEFGLNHKPFELEEDLHSKYELTDINYWLACWVEYYAHMVSLSSDPDLLFIDYEQLAAEPRQLLQSLSAKLSLNLAVDDLQPYTKVKYESSKTDPDLLHRATSIYQSLSRLFI